MARRKNRKGSGKVAAPFTLNFESTAGMAQALRAMKAKKTWEDNWDTAAGKGESACKSFYQLPSLESAFKLLENGDEKSAALIRAAGDIVAPQGEGAPQIEAAVVGCMPSVPNYLRGVPKSMLAVKREPRAVPVIDIYVSTGIPFNMKAEDVAAAGLKIANVVQATEMAGVRINLYAVCVAQHQNDSDTLYTMSVKVKDSTEPLNLLAAAFPLIHPAFTRAIFLHAMETQCDEYIIGHGKAIGAQEIEKRGLFDGVILSTFDILNEKLSEQDLADKINAYLASKKGMAA